MTLHDWGEPVEVAPERDGQLRRLLLSLLGVGLLIGAVAGIGSWVLGTFAQTEAGLCRLTWAACTELSLESVEQLSGLDLPAGTEVVSGYAQELGTLHEFRAEVILPEGGAVTMSVQYLEAEGLLDLPEAARDLRQVTVWARPISDGVGFSNAVKGLRGDRTVVVFDEFYTPAP